MGREIRKVPKGWEHPTVDGLDFKPMHDRTLKEAQAEWDRTLAVFLAGKDELKPDPKEYPLTAEGFVKWHGDRPEDEDDWYRPEFTGPADHFQYYETVSEGTPLSPVFATLVELEEWLVEQKICSRESAKAFCADGWAPSFVLNTADGKGLRIGIEAAGDES